MSSFASQATKRGAVACHFCYDVNPTLFLSCVCKA